MRRNLDLQEDQLVKQACKEVLDVVIALHRLDQRLADVAEWLPLPQPSEIPVPASLAEHLCSTIKTVRQDYFVELIWLLRAATEQDDLSLWLAFCEETKL